MYTIKVTHTLITTYNTYTYIYIHVYIYIYIHVYKLQKYQPNKLKL